MKFTHIAGAVAALAVSFAASAATADVYTLNQSVAFGPGTYGTVTTTQNGSNVDVVVNLTDGWRFVTTGGPHGLFTFNSNDPSYTVTNMVIGGGGTLAWAQPGSQPSYGNFTDAITCTSCANGAPGAQIPPLTFTVTNTTLANFVGNAGGYVFGADLISPTGGTGSVAALAAAVPEASTWAMMIIGFGMVGYGMRMRRRKEILAV